MFIPNLPLLRAVFVLGCELVAAVIASVHASVILGDLDLLLVADEVFSYRWVNINFFNIGAAAALAGVGDYRYILSRLWYWSGCASVALGCSTFFREAWVFRLLFESLC